MREAVLNAPSLHLLVPLPPEAPEGTVKRRHRAGPWRDQRHIPIQCAWRLPRASGHRAGRLARDVSAPSSSGSGLTSAPYIVRPMGCLVALLALISPRLALVAIWLFSDLLSRAFDSWILPLLGFFLLPWTTLGYAICGASARTESRASNGSSSSWRSWSISARTPTAGGAGLPSST